MAQRHFQSPADKLPQRELQGRLLPSIRRPEDRIRSTRQHDQDLGQTEPTVREGAHGTHGLGAVSSVRRQGHHLGLVRQYSEGVGRQYRRDGEHTDTSLRGGAASAVQ